VKNMYSRASFIFASIFLIAPGVASAQHLRNSQSTSDSGTSPWIGTGTSGDTPIGRHAHQ
jgi:hypothetical protein